VLNAVAILLPIFLLILILSTTSWIEPLLFLAAIGISILINMGMSLFLGRISFITNSVSPILQLACTLDYAIFLLHSFSDNRKKYPDVAEAMRHAVRESMSTIAASAATTLFGFLALVFMKFGIGSDLGLNLAKGIVLSFISVMVFLPALTLLVYKAVDRTRHRELMPSFQNVNRVLSRIAVPMVILVALLVVPSFLGQRQTSFTYGNSIASVNTRNERDRQAIEAVFGKSTVVALLVPRGDVVKERDLSHDIGQLDHVTAVVSYADQVGTALPPAFLDAGVVERFYSANHARIIVYTDTPQEGDVAFQTVESIQAAARTHYGDAALSVGPSASLLDMKNVVKTDNMMVNAVAVIAIFLILLITFRSLALPFFLLLTIETAIWINLSIPYFTGSPINFIGYLVICTVQLGATVDYAILLTTRYLVHRKQKPKREAIHAALGENFRSILVSGSTLAAAGFTLYATSSNPAISGLGLLLGRGTLLSVLMVTCFLPGMLVLFDKSIHRTTYKASFFGLAKTRKPLEEEHED
jgi:predicted RND superfamily exporter protein